MISDSHHTKTTDWAHQDFLNPDLSKYHWTQTSTSSVDIVQSQTPETTSEWGQRTSGLNKPGSGPKLLVSPPCPNYPNPDPTASMQNSQLPASVVCRVRRASVWHGVDVLHWGTDLPPKRRPHYPSEKGQRERRRCGRSKLICTPNASFSSSSLLSLSLSPSLFGWESEWGPGAPDRDCVHGFSLLLSLSAISTSINWCCCWIESILPRCVRFTAIVC